MPRPVKIRVCYREDAGYLLRLEAAVQKDDRQSAKWRDETAKQIRGLAMRLLEADSLRERSPSSSTTRPRAAIVATGGK